jgi:hypothetical protein
MIDRCLNPRNASYSYYGGRGIKIAPEFLTFEGFYAAVGDRPAGTTLDRIEVNGDYAPGNVRWAISIVQAGNTRKNWLVTFNGKTQCLSAWARETGLGVVCLTGRLRRGWTVEDSLTVPNFGNGTNDVTMARRLAAMGWEEH